MTTSNAPPGAASADLPDRLNDLISAALAALYDEAQTLVDRYWAQAAQDNAARTPHDRSYLGARARCYADQQTSIQWFRQQVISAADPQTGRRRVFSRYLPKGHGPCYPKHTLAAAAPAWQMETVLGYEAQFARLRRRQAVLVALRRGARQLAAVWAATEADDAC